VKGYDRYFSACSPIGAGEIAPPAMSSPLAAKAPMKPWPDIYVQEAAPEQIQEWLTDRLSGCSPADSICFDGGRSSQPPPIFELLAGSLRSTAFVEIMGQVVSRSLL